MYRVESSKIVPRKALRFIFSDTAVGGIAIMNTAMERQNDRNVTLKKVKADIALPGNPTSELQDVTCHMGSHSVTCHPTQVNMLCQTPAMQASIRFTYRYPGGMEG